MLNRFPVHYWKVYLGRRREKVILVGILHACEEECMEAEGEKKPFTEQLDLVVKLEDRDLLYVGFCSLSFKNKIQLA